MIIRFESNYILRKLFSSMILFSFIALSLLIFAGCGKKEPSEVTPSLSAEISMTSSPTPEITKTPAPTPEPTPAPAAEVEVTQAVARYFPDIEGFPTLYAAVEFKNTGSHSVTISEVKVTFNTGNFVQDADFSPMISQHDVVLPGQTSTLALWEIYEKEKDTLKIDSEITAKVELKAELYDEGLADKRLNVSSLRLIDNYPGFSTVSGKISNDLEDQNFALSLVYISFYDDSQNLLGVWHFTKNMSIPAGVSRNFVMHLQSLPIPSLSQECTEIKARALGID